MAVDKPLATTSDWRTPLELLLLGAICRVFDFEIDFSNGGGLQGQDFRLDIEGDDIADAQLADYTVSDMRLLMVGVARIRNKRVIEEAHKRPD